MKFLISHENGRDRYAIHFDKGRKMFYVSDLRLKDLVKLRDLLNNKIRKTKDGQNHQRF